VLIAAFFSFLPHGVWLVRTWQDLHLEHTLTSLLALPVAAGLVWLTRGRWQGSDEPADWGWALVAGALVGNEVGLLFPLPVLSGLALPVLLVGAVLVVRGPITARHVALPAAFLVFLLPLPWLLQASCALPSQQASAAAAFALLWSTGLDVLVSGVTVYTPEYYVIVNDTCSGLHSVCSLLMLGVVAAHVFEMSWARQGILLALVLPLGLLVNALRVAFLLLMGHFFGKPAATGLSHDLSAVIFFALGYVALFLLARRLSRRQTETPSASRSVQMAQDQASPSHE